MSFTANLLTNKDSDPDISKRKEVQRTFSFVGILFCLYAFDETGIEEMIASFLLWAVFHELR